MTEQEAQEAILGLPPRQQMANAVERQLDLIREAALRGAENRFEMRMSKDFWVSRWRYTVKFCWDKTDTETR